jgi:predicted nucleic acid-binding protein
MNLSMLCLRKKLFKSEALLDETLEFFVANFKVASIESSTVLSANYLRNRYQLAHYDSVIVASALDSKCDILYSEDMQHNLIIEKKLKIVNPFK